jgi:hypothetical protein
VTGSFLVTDSCLFTGIIGDDEEEKEEFDEEFEDELVMGGAFTA